MSYILDALRKADLERERDPARGIHAQPATGAPSHAAHARTSWAWPAACAVAAVVAGYVLWGRDEAPAPMPVPVVTAPVSAPATAAVVPTQAAMAPAVATSVRPPPPAPVERMVTQAVLAPRAAAPAPATAKPATANPATARPAEAMAAVATAPATVLKAPAAVAASAAKAPAADRILSIAELPADVQRDLPKLAISGGVHSQNAAQRMLIVGGQVMTEGQEVAAGVVLEQIRARSAVLRFRGLRYSVVY